MKIYVASDHAGFDLRTKLLDRLRRQGHEVVDLGPTDPNPTDYPDYAAKVGRAVRDRPGALGLLVCGSGIGVAMAANKIRGVRAAAPWNIESAQLSRSHNNANVLCLGARTVSQPEVDNIVDAWLATPFEGGRHARRVAKMAGLEVLEGEALATSIGGLEETEAERLTVDEQRARLETEDCVARIWKGDPQVFTADAAHAPSIKNRLGWLRAPQEYAESTAELAAFSDEVRRAGFSHAVLLGMGGSSLCPEVLAETFGSVAPGPRLLVLDNTDPAAVAAIERLIDFDRTLFVVASKSGGTIEVRSFEQHFWAKVLARHDGQRERAGQQFAAITDPGTKLDALAQANKYRWIFRNAADIGGRYSALSYFGLVPAALLGLDVERFLFRARRMADACREARIARNPGADLGALLGTMAKKGRDKLTLLLSPEIASLGAWIEQLVAESTGKLGRGIVPVDGEPLGPPSAYRDDRLFVALHLRGGTPAALPQELQALRAAGHPVAEIVVGDRYDLGAEFFRWELATAVAAVCLGVNPFDEPNVTEAKEATGRLLESYFRDKKLPTPPSLRPDDAAALDAHLATLKAHDYLALCAFFLRTARRDELLTKIRVACRDRLRAATTVGYGPRFLHSTGQLHKGGADNGVFVQLTADVRDDQPVPGEPFSFGVLRDAQALGDFQVLGNHRRRAVRVNLGADIDASLERLLAAIARPLPRPRG